MMSFEEWVDALDELIQEDRQRKQKERCLAMIPVKALEKKAVSEKKIE